jgi:hypothetical protein
LTRSGLESIIYRTQVKHANHYTTEVVVMSSPFVNVINCSKTCHWSVNNLYILFNVCTVV